MKKNVLICLEQLGIGGVETFVYNQVLSFVQKKYTVYVLARNGIYSKKIEKLGVKIYEFDYVINNKYDWNKIEKVSKILKNNDIDEVHIHQYSCIPYVMPAVVENNIPYVAYVHSIIKGTFEWYVNHYEIYRDLFVLYFNKANKIISITKNVQLEVNEFFGIPKENILVINNCLYFDKAEKIESVNDKNKFVLISRLSPEKRKSILNGIKLFEAYAKNNIDATLRIIGDGTIKEDIEKHVNNSEFKKMISFTGAVNNVYDYILNSDIVIGVDRCILEALAHKRLAIISGYEGLNGIVCKDNIKKSIEENFSGNNLKNVSISDIITQLEKINSKDITQYNYDYIIDKLDINNQNFTVQTNRCNYVNLDLFFKICSKYLDKYNENIRLDKERYDIGQENLRLQKIVLELLNDSNELKRIKNSKRWKAVNKLLSIFSK